MMETYDIIPQNVCCDRISVWVEGDAIASVQFEGGCPGNAEALARLLAGMPVERAMSVLHGVDCEGKGTSCADQFARGLASKLKREKYA